MIDLRKYANTRTANSLSNRFRNARFLHFQQLIYGLGKPVSILDVGGTVAYWQQRGWIGRSDIKITIINLGIKESAFDNVHLKDGNAINLTEYPDNFFDVVFSNSVIEHLFTADDQKKMADEIRRVGKAYWIQTPNYWFPVEPHFFVPGWQWLPRSLRIRLLMKYRCGWKGPFETKLEAELSVDEIRLLTIREMKSLFPGADIWKEKFLFFTKSIVAYSGFEFTTPDYHS